MIECSKTVNEITHIVTKKDFKIIKMTFDILKWLVVLLMPCFLFACVHTSSYVTIKKPDVLNENYIVRLDPNGNGSQVNHFLNAHKQHLSAGVCEIFSSEEGTPNDICIITKNGKVSLIVDYTQDEYAGTNGYRVSNLKHIRKNKFYSHFYKNYWLLEPYTPQ